MCHFRRDRSAKNGTQSPAHFTWTVRRSSHIAVAETDQPGGGERQEHPKHGPATGHGEPGQQAIQRHGQPGQSGWQVRQIGRDGGAGEVPEVGQRAT